MTAEPATAIEAADAAGALPVDGVSIRAWKPPVPGIREVFHARFTEHAYPPHTHDTWTLFIVDDGAIRYDLDRHARGAEPTVVSVLPPHVVHDGRPATSDGFRKRVVYLEEAVLGSDLIGRAVDRPAIADDGAPRRPLRAPRVTRVHRRHLRSRDPPRVDRRADPRVPRRRGT